MGVRDLNSFVNKIDGLRENYKLYSTKLVIDGKNLLYDLYTQFNNENKIDFLYGGSYTNYLPYFQQFFKNVKKCKIEPIVVLDGGLNPHLNENRFERLQEIFNKSKRISELIHTIDDVVFPFLLTDCFFSVLSELNIDSFQTSFDADLDSAKLANALECPILSDDSDFLIMNVKFGVISCKHFKWENLQELDDLNGNTRKKTKSHYIDCKIYKIENFVNKFTGLKLDMLPIFASLMGNDFINEQIFDDLFREIPFHQLVKGWTCERTNERLDRMNRVLFWLSEKFINASHAVNHITKYLEHKEKYAIKKFELSLNSYQIGNNETYLLELYKLKHKIIKTENLDTEKIFNYPASINNKIPRCFLIEFLCNPNFKSVIISCFRTKIYYLHIQIEDFSLRSCFDCCQDVFESICGLLRSHEEDSVPTRIVSRKDSEIHVIEIAPKLYLNRGLEKLPFLTDIQNLSLMERRDLFLKLLNFGEELIIYSAESFDDKYLGIYEDMEFWTYLVLVIKYWMQNSKTENSLTFVHAIVVNVIYYKYFVDYDEDEIFALTFPAQKSFSPNVVHYYSEFQVCYNFINILSLLLKHPIGRCHLHKYLNGILIYNLFDQINNKKFISFKTRRFKSIYWIVLQVILKK